jgi:TPP-dependent pyruvate/acetoin dehydrogenase alpha subunit
LAIAAARLRERDALGDGREEQIRDEARRLVEDALAFAESEPLPEPEEALEDVYAGMARAGSP